MGTLFSLQGEVWRLSSGLEGVGISSAEVVRLFYAQAGTVSDRSLLLSVVCGCCHWMDGAWERANAAWGQGQQWGHL